MPDAATDIFNILNENKSTDNSFFVKSLEGEVYPKKIKFRQISTILKKTMQQKIKIAISSDKVLKYRKYLCNL